MKEPAVEHPQTYSVGVPDNKTDPTGNVLQLVEAAVERLDDLRKAESKRVDEVANLRADYEGQLREAEAKRIDAIRAVDVNAVSVASDRANDQAAVLANQVAASAETLRNLVATTATTQAAQLSQITTQLTDRLASLEKAQYEGSGKAQVVDPQMLTLLNELKDVRQREFERTGSGSGMSSMAGWILSGILALVAIAGVAVAILKQ